MTDERPSWCLQCGRSAPVLARSLDSLHPIISCVRQARDGHTYGCGRTTGTYDKGEAERMVHENNARTIARRHDEHVNAGKGAPGCPHCIAERPKPQPRTHPYERPPTKWRLAGHLNTEHRQDLDRSALINTPVETLHELHERIHAVPV